MWAYVHKKLGTKLVCGTKNLQKNGAPSHPKIRNQPAIKLTSLRSGLGLHQICGLPNKGNQIGGGFLGVIPFLTPCPSNQQGNVDPIVINPSCS